jgi:hypothetical protein
MSKCCAPESWRNGIFDRGEISDYGNGEDLFTKSLEREVTPLTFTTSSSLLNESSASGAATILI